MLLNGKLVQLRPIEPTDIDRYVEWINDLEITVFVGNRYPWSRLAEEEFLRQAAKMTRPPEVTLAIETVEGRHIGSVSLHQVNNENRSAVLGIMIGDKDYWSRGYGTDTIVTLLRFAFDEMNLHRVALTVNEDNGRGIACYRKCGFQEEARLRQDRFTGGIYRDTLVMGVLAPEFRALHGAASSSTDGEDVSV